jgi:tetratricopeptide (TPR) repeat protein
VTRDSGLDSRLHRSRGLGSRAAALVAAVLLAPNALLATQNGDTAGILLFEAGKFREAKTVLEPAFRTNARDAGAAFYLGRIAMEERRNDKAADYFEAATKLDPKNSTYFLWLGRAYGREAQTANMLRQPGLAKRTKAAWERAIELDPENLDARANLIQYYVQAPGILGGSSQKALEQAEAIRQRNALRGYLELGALYERDKKFTDAENAYLAAAKEKSERHVGEYRL